MRESFKTGKVTEVFYKGHIITLTSLNCFLVREEKTGWVRYESSSSTEWLEVLQYIDNTTEFKYAS